MKIKPYLYSHPNHLIRRAIAREQKQFIKIAFAVHLSAVISAERYRSDSGALKSAVTSISVLPCTDIDSKFCLYKTCKLEPPPSMAELIVVYFYILCNIKKGLGFLRAEPLSSNFEDRRGYRGGKKVLSDKSVFPPLKTAPINDEAKKHNENLPGMGGVYNTVNLHVYHYAGNNPIKYVDPDGRTAFDADGNEHKLKQPMKTSKAGLEFIKSYEKLVLKPYNDGYGNWTIGYGHKITAKEAEAMKNGIDVDTADKFFQQDIKWIEDGINKNFDGVAPPFTK